MHRSALLAALAVTALACTPPAEEPPVAECAAPADCEGNACLGPCDGWACSDTGACEIVGDKAGKPCVTADGRYGACRGVPDGCRPWCEPGEACGFCECKTGVCVGGTCSDGSQ